MGEFLGFMIIIFCFGWGSAFLIPYLRRHRADLEPGSADTQLMARLLEDTERLETRLTAVEDELGFFKALYPGEEQERLPSPGDDEAEA